VAEESNIESHEVESEEAEKLEGEGFGELIKYTVPGFIAALLAGTVLDYFGFQRSGIGQWIVRTLSGEGESLFEGIYSIRRRLARSAGSMAEAYGWGKLLGMFTPWIVDWASRLAGLDVYAVEGFYIPYFYALSDQIGANVSGAIYLRKTENSWRKAFKRYFRHPVMVTSLLIILIVPLGLLVVRLLGFSPTTQKYTALETIAANLCWLPPVIGWLTTRRKKGRD
jgi:hypothetical protein